MIFIKVIISFLIMSICVINLSQITIKLKEYIFGIMGISALIAASTLLSEFLAGIVCIVLVVVMVYLKTKKILSSILYTVLSMVFSVLCDNILSSIIKNGFKNGDEIIESFDNDIKAYLIFAFFVFLLIYSISKLLGYLINKGKIIEKATANKKFGFILSAFLVLTFIFLYASVFIEKEGNPLLTVGVYVLYFLFIMVVVYILIAVTKKESDFINKKKELEQLSHYTKSLEILYNDMRKFRHDYINVLSSLIGYMESNKMEEMTEYFNTNIIPFSDKLKANDSKLGLLSYIEIPEVKGIIAMKAIHAQEQGIKVDIEVSEKINVIGMDIIDFCRAIGILLDNAIEGAFNSISPSLQIAFINAPSTLTIIVANSITDGIPPIHKMFLEGFSTKGENRGLGLSNLKEIISNHSNVTLDSVIEDKKFKQIIKIGKVPNTIKP